MWLKILVPSLHEHKSKKCLRAGYGATWIALKKMSSICELLIGWSIRPSDNLPIYTKFAQTFNQQTIQYDIYDWEFLCSLHFRVLQKYIAQYLLERFLVCRCNNFTTTVLVLLSAMLQFQYTMILEGFCRNSWDSATRQDWYLLYNWEPCGPLTRATHCLFIRICW